MDVGAFRTFYTSDFFYDLVGLASDEVYAAQKAAGGMTSFYRQLGIACERLARSVFAHEFALTDEQVRWAYSVPVSEDKSRVLTLDARLVPLDVENEAARSRLDRWLSQAVAAAGASDRVASTITGAVFDIRQGYKSADSKRQNADIGFGTKALMDGYLPCVLVFSGQVSQTVVARYRAQGLYVMLGSSSPLAHESTFDFFRNAVGWDLEAWLLTHRKVLRTEVQAILKHLLSVSD